MITDTQAREVALFFLLSLVDQKVALQAAHKAVAQIKALAPVGSNEVSRIEVAGVLKRGFEQHRKLLPRNQPTEMSDTTLVFPEGTDFATWQKFYLQASDAEITSVILVKILGFTEEEVAESFNVSLGTVKYRVAKGVRQLSTVVPV